MGGAAACGTAGQHARVFGGCGEIAHFAHRNAPFVWPAVCRPVPYRPARSLPHTTLHPHPTHTTRHAHTTHTHTFPHPLLLLLLPPSRPQVCHLLRQALDMRHRWLFRQQYSPEQLAHLPEAVTVTQVYGDPFSWQEQVRGRGAARAQSRH